MFGLAYAAGLRCVTSRLSRHDVIHAIYGHGSFFKGTCLYGHSDIDLVIVFRENVKRSEGAQYRVARTYDAVRRFFPFLGSWDEKEGSLVFLNELAAGFPPHATFRIRRNRGEFRRLHGEPFPTELEPGPLTAAEWLSEIDRLLRWAVLTGGRTTERLLFWERMFSKLIDAASALAVEDVLRDARARPELAFLELDTRTLFFRAAEPRALFSLFLELVARVFEAVREGSEPVRLEYVPFHGGPPTPRTVEVPHFAAVPEVSGASEVASGPIGLAPRLFYFSADQPIVVVDIEGDAYVGLRQLLGHMKKTAERSDAVVARARGVLFLLNRHTDFVDVLPLDPLINANLYARVAGSLRCKVPASVYEPQRAEAQSLFEALRGAYERHTRWLPKHSYPAIYREDDLDTIRDALDILQAYVACHGDLVVVNDSIELVEYLSERYPGSADFLAALIGYREFLERGGRGRAPANNLYGSLHRFVAEVLGGADDVEIDDYDLRLGITVGIITRNRAPDLARALESLTVQTRPPDEVIVVDNGSTDDTRDVVGSFEARLPLRYLHLAEVSIPLARNLVIERATREVISFTDDDCAIPPEWLSSVERGFLRADNVGIVGGWVEHWPADVSTMVDTYYEIFHNHKT